MRRIINLKKGLNLRLEGGVADAHVSAQLLPRCVAIQPGDYPGLRPKTDVSEGDAVQAGSALMHDKDDPAVKLVSPLDGTVKAIERGERRKILRIIVEAAPGGTVPAAPAPAAAPVPLEAGAVRRALKASGLWAMMRRRPYDTIPLEGDAPRDIMVTAMDTAPLAVSPEDVLGDLAQYLEAGVKALATLTEGHIYLGVAKGSALPDIPGTQTAEFPLLHPAGNAGVQISALRPVDKGQCVWTLDLLTLARIGQLVSTGTRGHQVAVAVTGGEVIEPRVVSTLPGAPLDMLLQGNVKDDGRHHRIISGNVLTGTPEGPGGYLRWPYRQVTVIPEGDDTDEFMGWASLSPAKMSESPSFLSRLLGRRHNPDARLQGGRRAMIMSGIYDRYMPMDILPEPLVKAILARDIEQMERLGIYEVAPEDFALAEYADPSKLELQRIVREGLDYMRAEA